MTLLDGRQVYGRGVTPPAPVEGEAWTKRVVRCDVDRRTRGLNSPRSVLPVPDGHAASISAWKRVAGALPVVEALTTADLFGSPTVLDITAFTIGAPLTSNDRVGAARCSPFRRHPGQRFSLQRHPCSAEPPPCSVLDGDDEDGIEVSTLADSSRTTALRLDKYAGEVQFAPRPLPPGEVVRYGAYPRPARAAERLYRPAAAGRAT